MGTLLRTGRGGLDTAFSPRRLALPIGATTANAIAKTACMQRPCAALAKVLSLRMMCSSHGHKALSKKLKAHALCGQAVSDIR